MKVFVKFYGTLRRHRPAGDESTGGKPFPVELSEGAAIKDLLRQLALDERVSAAALNGEAVELITELQDGDRVSLFPPAGGG